MPVLTPEKKSAPAKCAARGQRALAAGFFALLLGPGLLWLALVVGGGELRLYMLTGMLLGAVLWFLLLWSLLRPRSSLLRFLLRWKLLPSSL